LVEFGDESLSYRLPTMVNFDQTSNPSRITSLTQMYPPPLVAPISQDTSSMHENNELSSSLSTSVKL